MLKQQRRRVAAIRTRTLVIAAMAMVLPVTALAGASPAMAEPKGIFKIFKECPTEIPGVTPCSYIETLSGEVKLGKTAVPITKTIIQPVIFDERALGSETGTAVTLPIRVHLKNSTLGNNCYIGSESSPIELHLTTGATSPPKGFSSIHGKLGTIETLEEKELTMLRIKNDTLVDNNFTVPGSEGCGEAEFLFIKFKGFLDGTVNAKSGIPAKAGESVAKLNGTLNAASTENVLESEHF